MDFSKYLKETRYIDYSNPQIQNLAKSLAKDCISDEQIAKKCFTYVRDEIRHIGDYKLDFVSISASDTLKNKAGWCYTKALLLAALLRANDIPTALRYQRLSCSEYTPGIYCVHGLNSIYLKDYGWYRVDPRGNKEGVNAQFMPPMEKLAFKVGEDEFDMEGLYEDIHPVVLKSLETNDSYDKMKGNFPDIK